MEFISSPTLNPQKGGKKAPVWCVKQPTAEEHDYPLGAPEGIHQWADLRSTGPRFCGLLNQYFRIDRRSIYTIAACSDALDLQRSLGKFVHADWVRAAHIQKHVCAVTHGSSSTICSHLAV
jgi:hypothetical protein